MVYNEKPHFLVGFNIAQKAFKPLRREKKDENEVVDMTYLYKMIPHHL